MAMDKPAGSNYYRNLDSLRFIAAFCVILCHWFPSKARFYNFGKLGVDVFFVISGFLITEILLRYKQKARDTAGGIVPALKKFYIRRTIRVFPVYYLFLLICFFIKEPDLGHRWIYLFTYTTNFYMFQAKDWIYPMDHLWSLAVEEQFYLLWPFIILFMRKKYLPHVIIGSIILGILFIIFNIKSSEFFFVLPLSCISTLAFGALLALVKQNNGRFYSLLVANAGKLTLFFLLLMSLCLYLPYTPYIFRHLSIACFAFSWICLSINTGNRSYNGIFSNKVTSYLGKISYGIYLFHHHIPWLIRNLNGTEIRHSIGLIRILPSFGNGYLIFAEQFFVLIVICSLSWFLFEKPVNGLKERFA